MNIQEAFLNTFKRRIKAASNKPDSWVIWNEGRFEIVDFLWNENQELLYEGYRVLGTVSEAQDAIDNDRLSEFFSDN